MHQIACQNWNEIFSNHSQKEAIKALEKGQIIFLPELNFSLFPQELTFLTSSIAKPNIKNVSFNCHTHQLNGTKSKENIENLRAMLSRFQQHAYLLIQQLLPSYINSLQIGRTSFRPVEIANRIPKSYRKDDTRLHVDAFPSSPNQGKRILRVFANINPDGKARHWRTGESFEQVAKQFLPLLRRPWLGRGKILKALKITRSYATEYDYMMLQLHNMMKKNLHYQNQAQQNHIYFPPNTTWIVQTDHVSHAAMAGQHVLEQTFYLPVNAMQNPQLSPLKVLERLLKRKLV